MRVDLEMGGRQGGREGEREGWRKGETTKQDVSGNRGGDQGTQRVQVTEKNQEEVGTRALLAKHPDYLREQ